MTHSPESIDFGQIVDKLRTAVSQTKCRSAAAGVVFSRTTDKIRTPALGHSRSTLAKNTRLVSAGSFVTPRGDLGVRRVPMMYGAACTRCFSMRPLCRR